MAQITLYMDDESLRRIEAAAEREKSSVSSWVKKRVLQSLEDQWPARYFEMLGTLGKDDLERPPQPDFSLEAPRETL